MKQYIIKGLMAAGVLAMTACANHDLIPDKTEVGQAVPTVYWEVGSTVCKAGEEFSFQGKYNNAPGRTPLRSEVWYQIVRDDAASVSAKLAGTALNYTQTVAHNDTMRSYQCHASYPHKAEYWDGHQNIFTGTVPVSETLSPVIWSDATEWDQERFDTYYPQGFAQQFLNTVLGYLTDAETADNYYGALRNVFINYNFTAEQLAPLGITDLDLSGDDHGASVKSDAWYQTTEADESKIIGYYYITVGADGKSVYNEIASADQAPEGAVTYPVYDAAPWVFCRYDDNTGSILSTVRPEYLPKFRTLLEVIPFQDWIYDSANAVYKLEFERKYSLVAQFRSYDKDTSRLNDPTAPEYEGVVSPVEYKTISVN